VQPFLNSGQSKDSHGQQRTDDYPRGCSAGGRFKPLTRYRAKPSVPFGGKYRIIDKHVIIPDGEIIGFDSVGDRERFTVTDKGIIVIPEDFNFQ
jgi:ADP-glucose pyrophosphorylase